MFNKKSDSGRSSNGQGNGSAPLAPPQLRKPSSIAPLPPKRKDVNAAPSGLDKAVAAPEYSPDATFIGNDIVVNGSIVSSGEVIIEGTVEGDVRAQKIIVKNSANITGELVSEELIIHGRVSGVVRGIKILLASDCILNGDILHETLSIESGAQFEGSCKRSEDPLATDSRTKAPVNSALIKSLAARDEPVVEKIEVTSE